MALTHGTVILVRHADVTPDPEAPIIPGPPLNDEGRVRAEELRRVLAHAGVDRIFVSEFQRTRQTAHPLVRDFGIEVQEIVEIDELVASLLALEASSVVLVIGHSDTVPEVIKRLHGTMVTIQHLEFDHLFVLNPRGLIHARYGE